MDFNQSDIDLGKSIVQSGIKGQKWGDRKYQNEDGSLTPLGRERYSEMARERRGSMSRKERKEEKKRAKKLAKLEKKKYKLEEKHTLEEKYGATNDSENKRNEIKGLTDKQLDDRIKRVENELRLKDLEAQNKNQGAYIVKKAMKDSGSQALRNIFGDVFTGGGRYFVVKFVSKKHPALAKSISASTYGYIREAEKNKEAGKNNKENNQNNKKEKNK